MAISNAVNLANIASDDTLTVDTSNDRVGVGSTLTGIDSTALKDSGGNVKAQANPNGVTNSGGGGGGGGRSNDNAQPGGSGIVVVRYQA